MVWVYKDKEIQVGNRWTDDNDILQTGIFGMTIIKRKWVLLGKMTQNLLITEY